VAARLAPHFSVAVIEAGGSYQADTGNQSVVPYYALNMPVLGTDPATYQPEPLVDWDLISALQHGAAGRAIHYARGKTLGGSSALNTMAYVRGSKGTHDRWAEDVGDESYRWDSVLPFFKAGCQLTPPDLEKRGAPNATPSWDMDAFSADDDSTAGQRPLRVSFGNWVDPTTSWLALGLQGIGMIPAPKGLNSGAINGVGGWTSSTIDPRDATRSSSQTSYLELAEQEAGIKVYPQTQATKILFAARKATGVAVESQGSAYTLNAREEVILSAGVFHSPQILMVSGEHNSEGPA
jgi:choline dehydrogenase